MAALLHEFVAHLGLERLVPPAAIEDFLAGHERGENHTTDAETQTEAAAHACSTHRELAELRASVASLRAEVKTLQEKQAATARPEPETGGLEHDVAELRADVASLTATAEAMRREMEDMRASASNTVPVAVTGRDSYSLQGHLFLTNGDRMRDMEQYKRQYKRIIHDGLEYIAMILQPDDPVKRDLTHTVYGYQVNSIGYMCGDMFLPTYNLQTGHVVKGVNEIRVIYDNYILKNPAGMVNAVDQLKKENPDLYLQVKRRGWIPTELL